MYNYLRLSVLLLLTGSMAAMTLAQAAAPAAPVKHYKADFVVREVDGSGHVVNSRSFSTILADDDQGAPTEIRSGDKVPVRTSADEKGDEVKYQYIDLGVNIDCQHVREVDQKLSLSIRAEVSSASAGADQNSSLGPLIRQFKWNADVLIAPGVPTTIFSSDDMSSKSKMVFEVTATPVR